EVDRLGAAGGEALRGDAPRRRDLRHHPRHPRLRHRRRLRAAGRRGARDRHPPGRPRSPGGPGGGHRRRRGAAVTQPRFRLVRFGEGYDAQEVDDWIDRIQSALRTGDGSITAEQVLQKRFTRTRFAEGYAMDDVDDYLDTVAVPALRAGSGTHAPTDPDPAPERPAPGRPADPAVLHRPPPTRPSGGASRAPVARRAPPWTPWTPPPPRWRCRRGGRVPGRTPPPTPTRHPRVRPRAGPPTPMFCTRRSGGRACCSASSE